MNWEGVLLVVGIGMLLAGGQFLVRGASELAESWGVSELVIGLTVVAFGTSAPELAVNMLAALSGNTELAFGNVVGSNIANIGLVIGACAIARPLYLESVVVSREIPMMMLATLAALILGSDALQGLPGTYLRTDGLMLLLLFSVFLYYSAAEFSSASDAKAVRDAEAGRPRPPRSGVRRSRALARGLGGLAVLLIGADVAVSSALSIAELFGISKGLVGLSIVAIGTSLPELATSLIAAIRGQTNLAVGNVVGSNIFNLLFVLGATAFVSPVEIPVVGGQIDLLAMILFSVLLVPLSRAAGSHIPRAAGVLLFGAYVGFLAWRLSG